MCTFFFIVTHSCTSSASTSAQVWQVSAILIIFAGQASALLASLAGFRPACKLQHSTMAHKADSKVAAAPAGSKVQPAVQRHCSLCNTDKLEAEMQEASRCFDCNPLRQKLARLNKELHSTAGDLFSTPEERATFYLEHRGKLVADLKVVVVNSISQTQTRSRELQLVGTGTYLDEIDLKEKYKLKPGYAEKIMQRTFNFKHVLTDAKMYEDMEYQSKATQTTKRELKEEINMSQTEVPKRAKKAKTDKITDKENKAPALGDGATADKPFTVAQNKQVAKIAEGYTGMIVAITEIDDTITEKALGEFMPKHLQNKLATHKNKLEVEAAELAVCIEANTGDMKVVKAEFAAAKLTTKELSSRLESAVEEAAIAAEEAATIELKQDGEE